MVADILAFTPKPDVVRCPHCKTGTLEIVTDGCIVDTYHPGYHVAGTPLPTRRRYVPFGACSACEFCIEIEGV